MNVIVNWLLWSGIGFGVFCAVVDSLNRYDIKLGPISQFFFDGFTILCGPLALMFNIYAEIQANDDDD